MHDVIVANGRWHGGAMMLAPEREPDDGLFDVVLIGDVNKRDFVTTAPKIYKGTYLAIRRSTCSRATAVTVDAPSACRSSSTASRSARRPARFEIVPAALRVRVPA